MEARQSFDAQALSFIDNLSSAARSLTRNAADAEDLVQDTYVKAFRFADRFDSGTNLKAWLHTILVNTHRNACRRAARDPVHVDGDTVTRSAVPSAPKDGPDERDSQPASESWSLFRDPLGRQPCVNGHIGTEKEADMSVQNIKYGVYGGLAGGAVFGVMMGMMGMLPMIGEMVGSSSSVVGFIVHMVNSAIIGAAFAVVFGETVAGMGSGVGYGLGYGAIWWLLGPLTLMPLFMGMGFGVNWNLAAATDMMPSLAGHLIYGAILGSSYAWLAHRGSKEIGVHHHATVA